MQAWSPSSSKPAGVLPVRRRAGGERSGSGGAKGAVYVFLGPNGAGKTSTIRMLLGLKAPSAGTLRLLGEPVAGRPGPLLGRIGCLVEHPSLYPHLTAAENLRITCRMRNLGAREIPKALALVGLEASTHQLVSTFSLGMRQRLGLALAWLGEPELLILDRPTNGLDPAGMHWISSRWASMAVSIGSGMLGLIGPSSS